MMPVVEEITKSLSSIASLSEWRYVYENPYKRPFAVESEFNMPNLLSGKVHVRLDNSDIYILVISRDVFNWKDKIKDLKIKGKVIDAAGGLMWLKESNVNELVGDLKYLSEFLKAIKK